MVVSAVVFDLDDTLFDHTSSACAGLRAWLTGLDVAWSQDLDAAWFAAEERHSASWRHGLISFGEQRRRRLRDFLPLIGHPLAVAGGDAAAMEDAALDEIFTGYRDAYQQAWCGFDDVPAALAAVRSAGLVTAVLTNGAEAQQRDKLARLGLLEAIGPVFTAEALGVTKPDPAAFSAVCAHLALPAAEVLYVGDDHEIDVLGARAAGLQAVHLDRRGSGPAGEASRIASLAELATLLHEGTDLVR